MTDATLIASNQSTPPRRSGSDSVSISAISIWAVVQLVAMTLIISRVHFWIHAGDDADALIVMLISQMACASIFAPALTRNVRTAVCVALTALPFLHIAGTIASVETAQLVGAEIAVLIWLTTLSIAMRIARTHFTRSVMHAIVNGISIGGVIVYYLHTEFGEPDRAMRFEWFGPIAAGVTLAHRASPADSLTRAWIALGAVALIFLAAMILNRMILVARAPRD